MGRLNEHIARAANKEDEVKGRFWESRFKCQALLDEAAIAACMVYVDLNPIRAGRARTPEGSDFASIQERIRVWGKETMRAVSDPTKAERNNHSDSIHRDTMRDNESGISYPAEGVNAKSDFVEDTTTCWLCPISSDTDPNGILSISMEEYFDLVDRSGRIIRSDRQGFIEGDIEPILRRIGVLPDSWLDTVSNFGDKFHLVVGLLHNIRSYADRIGNRWFAGVTSARSAFSTSTHQSY